jgi:hypothetical protein
MQLEGFACCVLTGAFRTARVGGDLIGVVALGCGGD